MARDEMPDQGRDREPIDGFRRHVTNGQRINEGVCRILDRGKHVSSGQGEVNLQQQQQRCCCEPDVVVDSRCALCCYRGG